MKENNQNENKELKVPDLSKEKEEKKQENSDNEEFIKMPKISSEPKPWDKYLDEDKKETGAEIDFNDSEEMESYLSESVAQVTDDENEEYDDWEEERPKMSKRKKIFMGVSLTLGVILLVTLGTVAWAFNQVKDRDNERVETDLTKEELEAQQTLAPRPSAQLELDAKVVNVLLIGEEAIGENDQSRGRSDSMILVSMNTEQKTLKMVSFMRDCYVSIPGYRDNKLNASYNNGGGDLVMKTIEQNFGVRPDGYIRVNFEAFRRVINKIGGVEVTLTEDEARYLNSTNYISKKKNRCVKAGTQTLNGDQALGYCRVRYKTAGNGEADDFGRTYRQRVVIDAIFKKVKDMNAVEIASMVTEIFPFVKTSLNQKDILTYATAALSIGAQDVQSMRIPMDNAYSGGRMYCGAVLLLDFAANNKALQEFIYGTALGEVMTIQPQDSYEVGTETYAPSTVTYAPAATTKVYPTKTPVYTEEPVHTEESVITTEPEITEEPEEPIEPDVTENPPVKTEAPVKTEKPPVKTEAPIKTNPPVKTQAPVKTEPPAPPVMTDTPVEVIEPVEEE